MKFSEKWLREWVNPAIDTATLIEQLTMAGLEVDSREPVAGTFSNVVVARVEAVDQHPTAEKLSICQVSDGHETHQVVCGAPNVRAGLVTALARIGAVLPGDFKIKKAKLRQVESHGMLCAASELGLGDDSDGIMELSESLMIGADLRTALSLDDTSIEVDLTPNRGDCLSLRGLAREVSVLNQVPVSPLQVPVVAAAHDEVFAASLVATDACPRYLGRVIRNVDVTRPTPTWLAERLRRSGLRSIDPVVDVTNYVLLELGQPLHAFDYSKLTDAITVRYAASGEPLTLLDGKAVELDETTLVIADGTGPVAMAGVMGGARTAVTASTTEVFLECAFFSPLAVAGTARRYGIATEAGHRYERGVDPQLQQLAMERATALLLELAGGEAGSVFEAVEPTALPVRPTVTLRSERLARVAGAALPVDTVAAVFERLEFSVIAREDTGTGVRWTVQVPSHRFDVSIEADLIEEILRVHGYNNIPTQRPMTALPLASVPRERTAGHALKRMLASFGYDEVVTYSFVEPKLLRSFTHDLEPLALVNPMSVAQSVMRTTLLPGLVDVWRNNRARQQQRLRIFEVGQCFLPAENGLEQRTSVAGLLAGPRVRECWNQPEVASVPGSGTAKGATDFFDLKGDVERLLHWQGVNEAAFHPLTDDPALHPGQAASVQVGERLIGRLGRVHPAVENELDLEQPLFVFELALDEVLKRETPNYTRISRFPVVRRDLALLLDRSVAAAAVRRSVEGVLREKLVDFTVFDLFTGKSIESTKKSLGISLMIQDPSATLTEEAITSCEAEVLSALRRDVGAELRG